MYTIVLTQQLDQQMTDSQAEIGRLDREIDYYDDLWDWLVEKLDSDFGMLDRDLDNLDNDLDRHRRNDHD
jgi:hypothetical protein